MAFLIPCYPCPGKGFGSVVGGIIFEKYGAVITFRSYGISAFTFLAVFFAIHFFIIRPRKTREQKQKGDLELTFWKNY